MSRGGSQSARGVPGEAARPPPEGNVLDVGGHLPNYTIYGTQHRNYPTKDKAAFASVPERAEWTRKPKHRTRTELLEARRLERCPDVSADIDGDGAVGPTDYFIAKQFSNGPCQDKLRLNTGERRNVVEALEGGLLDKYSFGHEQAGAMRPFPVQQRRGMIVTVDNAHELSKSYPPHPISQNVPRHFTRTQMKTSQRAEVQFQNEDAYENWAVNNPAMIPEQQPIQEGRVEQPAMTSVSQRTEARKESARERAGLDPGSQVNPVRDSLQLGLGYREAPSAPTQTELLETRRARKNEELNEARRQGEQDYVPRKVHHVKVEAENFERGRPAEEPMTMTRLRFNRKIDGIEYDSTHFGNERIPQPARYSDQNDPWWTLQEGYVPEPPACLLRELQNPRVELPIKPTQVVPRPQQAAPRPQPASAREHRRGARGRTRLPMASVDPVVVSAARQMSRDFAPLPFYNEKEHKRNVVHNAQTFSSDSATMESFSTLSMGVPDSQNPVVLQRERRAKEALETARLWRDYTRRGGDLFDDEPASPLKLAAPMASQLDTSEESMAVSSRDSVAQRWALSKNVAKMVARSGLMSRLPRAPATEESARGPEPRRSRSLAQDPPTAAAPCPDLSMTARLGRLDGTAGGRGGEGHLAGMDVTQPAAATRWASAGGGSTRPREGMASTCTDASASHMRVRSSGFQWLSKRMPQESLAATAR